VPHLHSIKLPPVAQLPATTPGSSDIQDIHCSPAPRADAAGAHHKRAARLWNPRHHLIHPYRASCITSQA